MTTEALLNTMEQNYGKMTLWEWVREWIDNEEQCDPNEHVSLVEYLCLRAENHDEVNA